MEPHGQETAQAKRQRIAAVLRDALSRLEFLEQENASLHRTLDSVEASAKEARFRDPGVRICEREAIAALNAENSRLQADKAKVAAELRDAIAERDRLKAELSAKASEVSGQDHVRGLVIAECDRLKAEVSEYSAELASVRQKLQAVVTDRKTILADYNRLREALAGQVEAARRRDEELKLVTEHRDKISKALTVAGEDSRKLREVREAIARLRLMFGDDVATIEAAKGMLLKPIVDSLS